jgi:hypothetical protein
VLEGLLIALGDHLGKRDLILHCGEPELRDTAHGLALLLLGLLLGLLLLLFILLAGLNLIIGRLDTTVDYRRTTLVQRSKLAKVLLLEFQDLFLELSLEFGVLLLKTLKASDTAADGWGERFDVAGRATNELTQLSLDHGNKGRVAGEKRGSGGIVKGLFLDAGNTRLLGVRGDRSIVGRRVLRGRCDREISLLVSDGLRHDVLGKEKGRGNVSKEEKNLMQGESGRWWDP